MAFSLFDLGQALNAGAGAVNNFRQQRALGDLGGKLQSGDFEGAAQTALAAGDVGTGLELLKLGNQRKSDAEVSQILGGLGVTGGISAPAPQPQMAVPGAAPVASLGGDIPRGLRNMNPGNIEAGGFAQSQPGYAGTDGRFARFDTLEHGVGAQAALLDSYGRKGINTVAGVINRWAPPYENGKATENYTTFVARKVGVDPNTPIDLSNPETRTRLAYAMGEFENLRPRGSGQTGQNVQVADASGAIPRSAGGGDADALQQRLNVLSGLLARQNLSSGARAAIQAQIENTRNAISRSDRQTDIEFRRQERADTRAARQEELALKRQEVEAKKAEGKPPTEGQLRANMIVQSAQQYHKQLSDPKILSAGLGPRAAANAFSSNLPVIGSFVTSEQYKQFKSAGDAFAQNILYLRSGSAAPTAEVEKTAREFTPQPGDGKDRIEQLKKSREIALKGALEAAQRRIGATEGGATDGGGATTPNTTGGGTSLPDGWTVKVH